MYSLVSVILVATWTVAHRGCVVEVLVNRRIRTILYCVNSDISLVADSNVYPCIISLNFEINIPAFSNGISDMEKCDFFTAAFLCLILVIRPWTTYILSISVVWCDQMQLRFLTTEELNPLLHCGNLLCLFSLLGVHSHISPLLTSRWSQRFFVCFLSCSGWSHRFLACFCSFFLGDHIASSSVSSIVLGDHNAFSSFYLFKLYRR
jgi:hypothetical protein